MNWSIHTPQPVMRADLGDALGEAMFYALRSHEALPPAHPDAPPGRPSAEKRAEIMAAFASLGGPILTMRPQMEAAIAATLAVAEVLPDVPILASLYGHDHRISLSVEPQPEE